MEAAEAVCGQDAWATLDGLVSLVDKSLVIYEEGTESFARYRLLETVRQYSQERRQEADETVSQISVEARHSDYFLALAEEAEPHLRGEAQKEWIDRLETDYGNLSAAFFWTRTDGKRTDQELRFAGALWRFWSLRGRFTEGRTWLRASLEKESAVAPLVRAKALIAAGALAQDQGCFTDAEAILPPEFNDL